MSQAISFVSFLSLWIKHFPSELLSWAILKGGEAPAAALHFGALVVPFWKSLHISEWCPNLLSFPFPGVQCRWPAGCSVFPGLCFIFQDICWLPCDQLFVVSQIMNPQEQTSSQTKWHYEKQTPDIGTSAKQMEFWKGEKLLWKD